MYQLRSSKAKALFTCLPLLQTALEAATQVGLSNEHVYLLDLPAGWGGSKGQKSKLKTVQELIVEGESLAGLTDLKWVEGQGAREVAFLCYSSGTSGLPVNVDSNIRGTELTVARKG